jgi:multisubunit Na+/H+ antiporter MnhF subunit
VSTDAMLVVFIVAFIAGLGIAAFVDKYGDDDR